MRSLRKSVGRLKFYLIDHYPYVAMRAKGDSDRIKLAPLLNLIPPLPTEGPVEADLHMLCGKKHLEMGIWASWSVLRFLPGAKFFVHSDGTLETEDLDCWRRVIPNLSFTTKQQRDEKAGERLGAEFPLLYEWRRRQIYSAKFIDFHLFGDHKRVISLDSDVLCFRRPDEFIDTLSAPQPSMRWHRDAATSYAAPLHELEATLGLSIPERVNTGFLSAKQWDDGDLAFFEETLARLQRAGVEIFHHWAEQTLYAIAPVRHADAKVLGNGYAVTLGKTKSDAIIRHYVGVIKVRPRFFTEGVPILSRQLDCA